MYLPFSDQSVGTLTQV